MKYVQNITKNQLVLGRALTLAAGDFAPISDEEAGSTEVLHAIRASWANVTDTKPEKLDMGIKPISFAVPDVLGSPVPPGQEPVAEEVVEQPKVEAVVEEAPVDPDALVVSEEKPAAKTTARKPKASTAE